MNDVYNNLYSNSHTHFIMQLYNKIKLPNVNINGYTNNMYEKQQHNFPTTNKMEECKTHRSMNVKVQR